MQQQGRVKGSALFVFTSEVQMRSGGASAVAADSYGLTCEYKLVGSYKDFGQVAIADGDVTVADGDINSAAVVMTYLYDLSEHHGIDLRVIGAEVYAVMVGCLSSEWVSA